MITHPVPDPLVIDEVRAPWNEASLTHALDEHGLSVASWSTRAKQHLVDELLSRKARIVRHGKSVVRMVELVLVIVEYPSENLVLQEASRCVLSPFGVSPERTPTTRRRAGESIVDAAARTLCEKLDFSPDMARVSERVLNVTDSDEIVDFYPGLPCMVRRFLMRATVAEVQPSNPDKIGVTSGRHQAGNISYEWVPRQHAACFRKLRRGSSSKSSSQACGTVDKEGNKPESSCSEALDTLPAPILPWTETSAAQILEAYGIESSNSHFGVSLQELAAMLRKGSVFLAVDQTASRLLCVADTVCLAASAADGRAVVQKHPDMPALGTEKYSLPFQHKMPDETAWGAARRVAYSHFGHGGASECFCVHELPPEQVLPKGALNTPRPGSPTANMLHRVFLVSASINMAPSDFQPRF